MIGMERAIITINESGNVNIPDGNVWMSEMELMELFGVIAPTLQAAKKRYTKVEHLTLQQLSRVRLLPLQIGQPSTILK
jgi:hypothetical protein